VGIELGVEGKIRKLFFKERTLPQLYNMIIAYFYYLTRKSYVRSYPLKLTIDPANLCNLRCVMCPTGTKAEGRKQSLMTFDTFKKVIDELGKYLWEIDLFNWGEPFLNKDVFKMVKYARDKNIYVNISTNLNHFNEDMCLQMINSGLNRLIISLDGASQESAERYQKGIQFDLVINNIQDIVSMKKKLKNDLPILQWRFVVNKYNEHEVRKAEKISKELKIDILELTKFRCDMGDEILLDNKAQFENVFEWLPKNEDLSLYNYSEKQKKDIGDICKLLWFESVIHPDGSVAPCCAIWPQKFDFGNINNSSFRKIWNNEAYQNARRMSRGDKISIHGNICYICKMNKAQIQ